MIPVNINSWRIEIRNIMRIVKYEYKGVLQAVIMSVILK